MAQLNPTTFYDTTAKTAGEARVPAADFDGGGNYAGSNAPGIGINMLAGAVVGTDAQFTLLDQLGNARVAQDSQHIGGDGISAAGTSAGSAIFGPNFNIRTGTNAAAGTGVITPTGPANLNSLALGWQII